MIELLLFAPNLRFLWQTLSAQRKNMFMLTETALQYLHKTEIEQLSCEEVPVTEPPYE
jgi:hypothetical protein